MRLQEVFCDTEPRPHESTGADGKSHVVVEIDVCDASAQAIISKASRLTDSLDRRASESKHQSTQPKPQRLSQNAQPPEPIPTFRALEIKEPPPCIPSVRLPPRMTSVPPESEADEGAGEGGCEVPCKGLAGGEGDGGDEGEVGGEGRGVGTDEAADG